MYPKRDDCGIDGEERSELPESLLEAVGVRVSLSDAGLALERVRCRAAARPMRLFLRYRGQP
ncbi:MAG: hypothetical protein ACQETQ_12490 [Spirochaetota bacterium]